jgi:hypothetical protein
MLSPLPPLSGDSNSPLQLLPPLHVCLQVWELVPAALQESLQELVGEQGEGAVEEAEVSALV